MSPGVPVGGWPAWPSCDERTLSEVRAALQSGRWAVSGEWTGEESRESRFARAWARFVGTRFCVPVTNGTAALSIALEALGVGCGDEVLVPGLTWVACAGAVANVNAVPVPVDVDPATLCMDPEDAERCISARTRAILMVHLYGSLCDVDALGAVAGRHGLALIEDAAHAHGAAWRGRRTGSLGACGAFSMQQTKLLTAGEGGAVTTDDRDLADRLQQLRADSRRHRRTPPEPGALELEPGGGIQGSNHCLSEVQAAILLAQMESLEARNLRRARTAALLDEALGAVHGVVPQACPEGVTTRSFYRYAFRIDPEAFQGRSASELAGALSRRLGIPVEPVYPPLPLSPLWRPSTKRRFHLTGDHPRALEMRDRPLPVCTEAPARWLSVHHRFLLAEEEDVRSLPDALADEGRGGRR